jgi:ABC-type multidrug transport system fused ATPase/permease subunit
VDVPDATRLLVRQPALFSGTVAENIGNGRPGTTFLEIIEAAQLADAHRSILVLPDGYDTQVGENGERLSEAERQRIAIARAVLCDPKILVLDGGAGPEARERLVQEAVRRLTRVDDTAFVIAHSLSGVRDTDRLVLADDGRVLETGSYQDVIARKGAFRHLVDAERGMLSVVALGDRR